MNFIFSKELKYTLARHIMFWLFFSLQTIIIATHINSPGDFFIYHTYVQPLYYLFSVLPGCIFSVYIAMYLLFPFLQRKRYKYFVTGFISLVIVNCIIALFFYAVMRRYTCPGCDAINLREKVNTAGNNGINVASFMAVVALGIKFTKNWYQQQIKNSILARQKITNELKLLKSSIQPDFLFNSLQALYSEIAADKQQSAEIILKFSEILSYMLYECNEDFVLLQKELDVTGEFILLEKMTNKANLMFFNNVNNTVGKKYIPSFSLLSLIQNCVTAFHETEQQKSAEIKIYVNGDILYCDIIITPVNADEFRNIYVAIVDTFTIRLKAFYQNRYTLQLTEKDRGICIRMSLLLQDNFSPAIEETIYKNYTDAVV